MDKLTVSSDAHTPGGSPEKLFSQLVSCIREHGIALETVIPCFTRNPAEALKLSHKGRLEVNADADLIILKQKTFEIVHVFAGGQHLVEYGELTKKSQQTQQVEESEPT
jgi:beta-aspartyl-dipeptidase (metallo-type)